MTDSVGVKEQRGAVEEEKEGKEEGGAERRRRTIFPWGTRRRYWGAEGEGGELRREGGKE